MRNFQKKRTRSIQSQSHDTGKFKFGIFIVLSELASWLGELMTKTDEQISGTADVSLRLGMAAKTRDSKSEESNSMIGMMIRF